VTLKGDILVSCVYRSHDQLHQRDILKLHRTSAITMLNWCLIYRATVLIGRSCKHREELHC